MLKTISKTTLFVTMALVSGSFLRADEPILVTGLQGIVADTGVREEACEPMTIILPALEKYDLSKVPQDVQDALLNVWGLKTTQTPKEATEAIAKHFKKTEAEACKEIEEFSNDLKRFMTLRREPFACHSIDQDKFKAYSFGQWTAMAVENDQLYMELRLELLLKNGNIDNSCNRLFKTLMKLMSAYKLEEHLDCKDIAHATVELLVQTPNYDIDQMLIIAIRTFAFLSQMQGLQA